MTDAKEAGGVENVVAVVIPCYKVGHRVLEVIAAIGPEVHQVYVVDDACPEQSWKLVQDECRDPRLTILDLHPTGPLWGMEGSPAGDEIQALENAGYKGELLS